MQKKLAVLVDGGCDLSLRQLHILYQLCAKSPRSIVELALDSPGMDTPAVSRAVERLRELGYVVREPHPTDRRSVQAKPTAAGRAFVQTIERVK